MCQGCADKHQQRGLCAICGGRPTEKKSKRLHVDHEHGTDKFRGLLCGRCNRGLGMFKDSSLLLRTAALYVEGRPQILIPNLSLKSS